MTDTTLDPYTYGRSVLGPVTAEFSLRLRSLATLFERPDDAVMLFCARGGLRMLDAYERYLTASGLATPLPAHPLMVSRLVALRAALSAPLRTPGSEFGPAAAAAIQYEFSRARLRDAIRAISGLGHLTFIGDDERATPSSVAQALARPELDAARRAITAQAELFAEHWDRLRGGRSTVLLVDTGLYGTTGQLLAEAFPAVTISTALLARTFRPLLGAPDVPAIGLLAHDGTYNPLRRRTVLLRYWHFVEWLFEPALPSVRTFTRDDDGEVRSNLETSGWRDHVSPAGARDTWAGVVAYLDALPSPSATVILGDAERAWSRLHHTIVWPRASDAATLSVGIRSHDFGRDATWGARTWRGPIAALRGSTMWREGEIASSGTLLRVPLLAAIETAYTVRLALRSVR